MPTHRGNFLNGSAGPGPESGTDVPLFVRNVTNFETPFSVSPCPWVKSGLCSRKGSGFQSHCIGHILYALDTCSLTGYMVRLNAYVAGVVAPGHGIAFAKRPFRPRLSRREPWN